MYVSVAARRNQRERSDCLGYERATEIIAKGTGTLLETSMEVTPELIPARRVATTRVELLDAGGAVDDALEFSCTYSSEEKNHSRPLTIGPPSVPT